MFIIKTASASMPSSCKGQYRRIAVIELNPGYTDCSAIDARHKSIKRIVMTWERCHVGKTERGCYQRCLVEAENLVKNLSTFQSEIKELISAA